MEKLVILDYTNADVHIYNVDVNANINDTYIENLGFNTNSCYWMFSENMEIIHHRGILL